MKSILTFVFIALCLISTAQEKRKEKLFSISKNDLLVMGIEIAAGYGQGWRDEVLYHPNQLFRQFPNLNRNFWDIRTQNNPGFLNTEWDADHVLKGTIAGLHILAVSVKVGDLKEYKGWKNKVLKVVIDGAKYYLSYKIGFTLAYNITHKNKF